MPEIGVQADVVGDYCGAKRPPPKGRALASPNVCYRKGLKVGYVAASKKAETKSKTKQVISAALGRQKVIQEINKKALTSLKRELRLSNLNKDEVRSIAVRYTGTVNAINGYSRMSMEELKQELRQRGWQD